MKVFVASLAILGGLALIGCQRLLEEQAAYRTYGEGRFFKDGKEIQAAPAHTVPVESSDMRGESSSGRIPLKIDKLLLQRGQARYQIYCVVCHGVLGDGLGIVTQRGFPVVASFHSEALRGATDAHIYDVIGRGYGKMYRMGDRIVPRDRWAIVAYVRALQRSQSYSASGLSASELRELRSQEKYFGENSP